MMTRLSSAALSMVAFAGYITLTGLVLVIIPNLLLTMLRLPTTSEPWIVACWVGSWSSCCTTTGESQSAKRPM